ncbi:hypothetical protein [Dipodfec virus RodF1_13]|uniref:Uncharacterized protein n=1 Tax=Dipodfec virus RodF1_13 TaxID=2929291 RepID=A0A976N2I1_9VIRU|nr:hypothetical protein [Dipodfec virus RodF1_13]
MFLKYKAPPRALVVPPKLQSKIMEENVVTQFGFREVLPNTFHYVSDLHLIQLNEKVAQNFGNDVMNKLREKVKPTRPVSSDLTNDQIFQTIPDRYRSSKTDVFQDLMTESLKFDKAKKSLRNLVKSDLDFKVRNKAYNDVLNKMSKSD